MSSSTTHTPDDGRYYAKHGAVHKAPVMTKGENGGQSITMGFPVCTMTDYVGDDAAEAVAGLMNRGEVMPELLEALKYLRDWALDNAKDRGSHVPGEIVADVDHAIAKAEGRTDG